MKKSQGRVNKFSEEDNRNNIVDLNKENSFLSDGEKPKFIEKNGVLYFTYRRGEGKIIKINANHFKKYHNLLECFLDGIPLALENIQEITIVGYLRALKN